jgi:asparagine synthase (glutamine-hydrolysing)
MCGICAHTSDPAGTAVARMLARLHHRGPDDEGTHVDREHEVALGARRLSVIDVHGGHQPVSNEDGTVWAILNGEIYNHPELQRRLESRGHVLASRSDTEVLVHLYEDFGPDLVSALDGMYSFVLWDSRRRRLVAARDRFGEKPLFYVFRDGQLVLASELTALLDGLDTDVDLSPEAVDAYFVFGYVPGPGAIDRRVSQLRPGHLLIWDADTGHLEMRAYYQPPIYDAPRLNHYDVVAEAERLLEQSVRVRMIADVPLGVFLSGGVDSTLVAALASRVSPDPISTFTIGYDVGRVSETGMAEQIARSLGTDHHEVILTECELVARASEQLGRLDQPLADPALLALNALADQARGSITVALGGEGADELFAGYPRYRWLARAERLGFMVPRSVATRTSEALRGASDRRAVRRIADVVEPVTSLERHLDWVTAGRRHVRGRMYGAQLRRAGVANRAAPALLRNPQPAGVSVQAAFMYLDQTHWLVDDVLAKADRATMLASLEMRTPFLSREIAGLAAAVPTGVHARGNGKHVLRQVLARLDLPEHPGRRKQAFRVPVDDWLRGPLAASFREQLGGSTMYEEEWFDRRGVRTMAEDHARGSADHSAVLWPVYVFGCWLDRMRGRA